MCASMSGCRGTASKQVEVAGDDLHQPRYLLGARRLPGERRSPTDLPAHHGNLPEVILVTVATTRPSTLDVGRGSAGGSPGGSSQGSRAARCRGDSGGPCGALGFPRKPYVTVEKF